MNKLFTLMVLGSVASLSADYYGNTCSGPNCPNSGGYSQGQVYQGGAYYNQGSNYQGNYYQGGQPQTYQGQVYQSGNDAGYYQNGSRPVHVGTRPVTQDGRNIDQNQQYMQKSPSNESMNRNDSRNVNQTAPAADLNKRVREALSGGWFSSGYKNVTFEVNGANVTLRGTVDSNEHKKNAEDAVRKVDGVQNVNNQITVNADTSKSNVNTSNGRTNTNYDNRTENKYSQDAATTNEDRQLNAKIRERLKSGLFSKGYETLILRTSNGIVVISGNVDTQDDVQKVHDEVKKVEGVRSVNNQLNVKNAK